MLHRNPVFSIAAFFAAMLAVLALFRLGLVAWQWDNLADVPLWRIFVTGARMDTIVLCYLLAPVVVFYFLLPAWRWREPAVRIALAGIASGLIFIEASTPGFFAEYDRRPDRIFYEYLVYPREVALMLFSEHKLAVIGGVLVAVAGIALARRGVGTLFGQPLPYRRQLLILPLLAVALFLGARSTLGHRPANISTASFSTNRVANELALNSAYSLGFSIYSQTHEADPRRMYGSMPADEILARVRKYADDPAAVSPPEIPTLHAQASGVKPGRPRNLVVILQESLGAGFVGSLGGLPLTPQLDALSREGLYLTRLYATGTRTARGMEAVIAGFPPSPAQAALKLPGAQNDFFTLASLLRRHGYRTEFIFGGVANFDNMRGFFLHNGFERVIEQADYAAPRYVGSWGVSDEDLFEKANATFKAHGDEPFFAFIMTSSNHDPFEYPEGRIEPYEQPVYTRNNAVKYADLAMGRFFEQARREDYFRNTVFVIAGDHDARVFGRSLVPVERFHVPALILGPDVPVRRDERLASQIDLPVTALHFIGVDTEHPMIGHNLMRRPPGAPGAALMQYGEVNGFRVGDRLVVHQPQSPPKFFAVDATDALIPAPADPELARDALAHALWPFHAYEQGQYHLPPSSIAALVLRR